MNITLPNKLLVDANNIDELTPRLIEMVQKSLVTGYDLETFDVDAHPGIKAFRKESAEGDKKGKKVAFDWRRMTVAGLSLYPSEDDTAYYFNLNHLDAENRVPWFKVKKILDAKPAESFWAAHNAPFELTVMSNTYNYLLENTVCTQQMAVSAYGPDEYDSSKYPEYNLGGIPDLFEEAVIHFSEVAQATAQDELEEATDDEEVKSKRLTIKQQDLVNKVIGKSSQASYSYNGFNTSIAYGYSLKKAVMSHFGYKMETYEECLRGRRHMGELTGAEVVSYGADDAFWAVQLFFKLLAFMSENCPQTINTFFTQENPMIYVYSDIRREGMYVNKKAIKEREGIERKSFAQTLRNMKAHIRDLLPFPEALDERLEKYEDWYGATETKSGKAKEKGAYEQRRQIADWANSPDSTDDFVQACQVSSPVSNNWKGSKNNGPSIGHYYKVRTILYDLCRIPAIIYKGKVVSDAECRGEVRDKIKQMVEKYADDKDKVAFFKSADELVKEMGNVASIEQRIKLYITPYLNLTDPETQRMYPEVSSMLATRRMASSNPNPMQLAKRGESVFIRGFYEPDADDEVLVSLDWSQIELVLIGEFSGDKEFAKAYGQLPYQDLHLGAAADVLSVLIPEVTEKMMKEMHNMEAKDLPEKLLVKPNGDALDPKGAKKFWRTEVGKGSNFNYWYSGALATVAEKLGMSSKQMWEATERYRGRFPEAEQWRVNLIEEARQNGYITLPDGHRRVRYEATYAWQNITKRLFDQFENKAISLFGEEIVRAIKSRAGNQIVNSMIQGSCATLAKRSILRINAKLKETGLRARFKMPIHDELLFSVHRDDVVPFIKLAKEVMCDHPDIIKNLKVDATASIGLTFEPFHETKSPYGQVELDEAPAIFGFGDGVKLNEEQTKEIIEYLFKKRLEVTGEDRRS